MNDAVELAVEYVASRCPHQLVAINAAKVVLAHQRPEFRRILWNSDLAFVDGQPLRFAGSILGHHLPELISGHFLMERLIARAAENGLSVYFLGAKLEAVGKVVGIFQELYPALRVAGWRDGFWRAEDEREVVREARRSGADMLFLALGTPRKEEWIARYKEELEIPVCMGVGGSFDVIAGTLRIEPAWMRNVGLAWLFRLIQEPRRMGKRYISTNPVFVQLLLQELWHRANVDY
ncbi:MAG: WecB/TagA/CpsF family glycosyltransferase [Chloroflexi bacterium]|nr:WecB/TagA/CpsF family glycosyltransferase [Chloroflexota bacterium]